MVLAKHVGKHLSPGRDAWERGVLRLQMFRKIDGSCER